MEGRNTHRKKGHELSRRSLVRRGAAGTGALLLASRGSHSSASSGMDIQSTGNRGKGQDQVTLNALYMKQAAYSDQDVKDMTAAFEEENPDISVDITFVAYEALHDKIVTAAPAGTYDTILTDVIWPAEFASKNMVEDISDQFPESERDKIFPGVLKTTEYEGDYYGLPWIADTKYFFYNQDMLDQAGVDSAPDTWDDVISVAKKLKSEGVVKYPLVWSWGQAEALICDYTQLLGAFGGQFLDDDGNPAFNSGGGLEALKFMRMTLDEELSNPASTESLEEDVRRIVSQGEAAMALNWVYMHALANDPDESQVAGSIEIAHTPEGSAGAPGVNGCMGLCVSSSSQNKDAALRYIQFMTSQEVQDQYAQLSLPIWKSSYEESALLDSLPDVVPVAKDQMNDMILRPVVTQYNNFSHTLQVEIQNALLGNKSPEDALDDAAESVKSML